MKICLEYVSANPNGPITIQHARAAVIGDILARLFAETGAQVTREFYVNDAPGTTLTTFARSVATEAEPFATEIARSARGATLSDILAAVRARQSASLEALGVGFDVFTSEAELLRTGEVDRLLTDLTASGHTSWRGGALWLRDGEQNWPLVRTQGGPTYLASDLAYHRQKLSRGFDLLIDLWDADHEAYVGRTRAGLRALGFPDSALKIGLVAPVRILKDNQERRVGRYGASLTLEETLALTTPQQLRGWFAQADPSTPQQINLDVPTPTSAPLQTASSEAPSVSLTTACEAVAPALERARQSLSPRPVAEALQALTAALATEEAGVSPVLRSEAEALQTKLKTILGI